MANKEIIGAGQDKERTSCAQLPKPYYQDSSVTIYNADCREIMPYLANVDAIISDPPYELDTNGGNCGCFKQSIQMYKTNEYVALTEGINFDFFIPEFERLSNSIVLFASNDQISKILNKSIFTKTLMVWNKYNAVPFSSNWFRQDAEWIISLMNKPYRIFGSSYQRSKVKTFPICSNKSHPSQKPINLIDSIFIMFTQSNDTILDPFMGSGTSLLVAKNLGRKAIGIEIEEKYCEIAAKRMAQEVMGFGQSERTSCAQDSPAQCTMDICHTATNSPSVPLPQPFGK